MKYLSDRVQITFAEVPDEISLCIPITGCKGHCKGCHSPWLWEDTGTELNWGNINALIHINKGISCVCLLGGDHNPKKINEIASHIKKYLKVCWYSGKDSISKDIDLSNFNYIKIGHYDKAKGGLGTLGTNQKFYAVENNELIDITYKFLKHDNQSKENQ